MLKPLLLTSALVLAAPALARPMTATDLATLRRLSAPAVSPDGRLIAYTLRETDLAANKGRTDVWIIDADRPASARKLAALPDKNESDAQFSPDGRQVYFLSDQSGSSQVWRVDVAGGQPTQVTNAKVDLGGFMLSPDGARLAVWADVEPNRLSLQDEAAGTPSAGGSGRTYDQLFVRHWDSWADGKRSALFVYPLVEGVARGGDKRVSAGLVGDVPSKPFGGGEEIAWAPDGRTIYFALREAGRIEALSTNLDIFAAPADGSAAPNNLTKANAATDTFPTVSPDGKWLAWAAMKRPGYESDRLVIQLRNLTTGETRALTDAWDRSVSSMAWAKDGRSLLVTAGDTLEEPLFRVDVPSGRVTRLTQEGHVANVRPLATGGALYTLNSVMTPDDLYRLDRRGRSVRLTTVNADKLAELDPVTLDRYSFKGANGDTVWGIRVKPLGTAPLPIAFVVHGGPQGSFGNSWSYRWNPRVLASAGYGVVSVDFHGSTGYGQAFTDSIRNNWGGWPLEDLKAGLATATAVDPRLDANRACALGASYGGYMMNWIEGNWPDRFRCIVQHDGVFDARAMAYETEELWFDEWEHGGKAYFEDSAAYERWNPVNHVTKWKTPQLVITSEKDFRIPYTQGLAAFTALQRRNIPSRLLVFPDENHWVLKPKNSIQWHGEVVGWLDRWLKDPAG